MATPSPQPSTMADFFNWTSLIGPAVIAAAISAFVVWSTSSRRFRVDRELAERRITADIALAERRFGYERDLAERKFAYDREFNDHKRRVELAEEVLTSFLKMRDIMREVRSPAAFGNEGGDRVAWEGETDQQAKVRHGYFVPASWQAPYDWSSFIVVSS